MIYLLILLLLQLIIIFYILFDRNILSPSIIGTAMFIISSTIAAINKNNWYFQIEAYTVLIIVFSLIFFGLGELFLRLFFIKRNQFIIHDFKKDKVIEISSISITFIVILFGILFLNYYNETLKLAIKAGYEKNNGNLMLYYARIASLNKSGVFSHRNRLAEYSSTICKYTAYVFSYIFLYNKIIMNKKKSFKYLLPILIYIPFIIYSTGRTQFIYLISVWIIVGSTFFMQKKNWNPKYTMKIIKIGVSGILFFLVLFILAGSLKTKSLINDMFNNISIYIGLSIPSLDLYFKNIPYPDNKMFGEHTFYAIYGVLRALNHNIPQLYGPLEFVRFHNASGNVYSIIRRYHQDFGTYGLFIIMFFLGLFYSYLFLKYNNSRKKVGLIFYASIFSPIVEMSIEERFFMHIFSYPTIQGLIIMAILFKIFINKKNTNRKSYFIIDK